MRSARTYASVILPLRLGWEPCYCIEDGTVQAGTRVSVIFAGRRYTGVVSGIVDNPDVQESRIRPIERIEDGLEQISAEELELWRFIADYYMCSIGEVYKAAYPQTRTRSEQIAAGVRERARQSLERRIASISDRIARLEERLGRKEAALAGRHKPEVSERLAQERDRIAAELQAARESLRRLSETQAGAAGTDGNVKIEQYDRSGVTLLRGPHRIDQYVAWTTEALAAGRDVLWLVPEIAFTDMFADSLESLFPGRLMTFHSQETPARRRAIADRLRQGPEGRESCIVMGTRSSLFLPFNGLGLIIVDQEHDPSYKQDSPAPRYNGRDTAVMLGRIHHCPVVLGSSTPSLEALHNCQTGRYGLIELPSEAAGARLEVVDTSAELRKNGMLGSISRKLADAVAGTLADGGKVLILRPWGPVDDLEKEVRSMFGASDGIIVTTTGAARRKDFGHCGLTAVIQADTILGRQDFRADEKAIQFLCSLRERTDVLFIQTRQKDHPAFYSMSTDQLLPERREFGCPPFTRLVDIHVYDGNEARLEKLGTMLALELEKVEGIQSVMGPFPLPAQAGRTEAARCIRLTLPRDRRLQATKTSVNVLLSAFEKERKYQGHISTDVDPV